MSRRAAPSEAAAGIVGEISDLALLSNCQAAGLVDGHGCIRWLCWPRFDSPPLFAGLLEHDGGLWQLEPVGPSDSSRRYLSGSLVLRTVFQTPTGRAELTDALVLGQGERGHDIGMSSPQLLVRRFAVTEGQVTMRGCLMPRGQFGRVLPVWAQAENHLQIEVDGHELALRGPAPDWMDQGRAFWQRSLRAGQSVTFALGGAQIGRGARGERDEAAEHLDRLTDTLHGWQSWSALHDSYRGGWRQEVRLSGRLLQGLTFAPTGAVIAAPTTSLPTRADGAANRDYRLVVMEDAPATTAALRTAACATEAGRGVDWLLDTATSPADAPQAHLRAVLPVDGPTPPAVAADAPVAPDVPPVRLLGQGWTTFTPDAVGDLLAALHEAPDRVPSMSAKRRARLRVALAGAREAPAAPEGGARSAVTRWSSLHAAATSLPWLPGSARSSAARVADHVARQVRDQGWDASTGTFTAFAPSSGVEASSLLLSLSGLVAPDDPAMVRTVERVADVLSAPCGLLYRYEKARGVEGPSIVCTYWLVRCLAAEGQLERAEALFEQTTAYANDVGLLSEQSDPDTGRLLGNFPYAASHAGLILAARDLQQGRERVNRAARTSPPR